MSVNREIKSLLIYKKPIPKLRMYQWIRYGVLTGSSQFYGSETDLSQDQDIDLVLPQDSDKGNLFDELVDGGFAVYPPGIYQGGNFATCYCKTEEGKIYNLIICHSQDEFDKWKFATLAMLILLENPQFKEDTKKDKELRVKIFEGLKNTWDKSEWWLTVRVLQGILSELTKE